MHYLFVRDRGNNGLTSLLAACWLLLGQGAIAQDEMDTLDPTGPMPYDLSLIHI